MTRRKYVTRVLLAALGICALGAASGPSPAVAWELPPGPTGWRDAGLEGIRGVTVGPIESSQQPGRGYGTETSAALLDHLATMGVNWISITPFGRLWSLEDTVIKMDFEAEYEENRVAVRRMIHQAHARGMRVLVIPHLWVETTGWRGDIDPGSPEAWAAYQESYRRFVLRWAFDAAAAGADAMSIGVECKSWSGRFAPFWYDLIASVRSVFPGLLTYSANWDEADDVVFWDHLDFIGINAFYPLAEHDDATYEEYLEGAERRVADVAETARLFDKPMVFVEVGYTSRPNAAVEPWLWPDDMEGPQCDEVEQARALDAMLRAFLGEEWFAGFFVWRYYANLDDVSQEAIWGFSPHAKLAADVLEKHFRWTWAVDPGPWPWSMRAPPLLGASPYAGSFPVP